MARKGYNEELLVKTKLQMMYGDDNVIKVAIGSFGGDFICVRNGRIALVVEVKACHQAKYYPSPRDEAQKARIKKWCIEHNCNGQVWVKYPFKAVEVRNIWSIN